VFGKITVAGCWFDPTEWLKIVVAIPRQVAPSKFEREFEFPAQSFRPVVLNIALNVPTCCGQFA
jgi:hypothetical protein